MPVIMKNAEWAFQFHYCPVKCEFLQKGPCDKKSLHSLKTKLHRISWTVLLVMLFVYEAEVFNLNFTVVRENILLLTALLPETKVYLKPR